MSDFPPESEQTSERDFQKAEQRVKKARSKAARPRFIFQIWDFYENHEIYSRFPGRYRESISKVCSQLGNLEPLFNLTRLTSIEPLANLPADTE